MVKNNSHGQIDSAFKLKTFFKQILFFRVIELTQFRQLKSFDKLGIE